MVERSAIRGGGTFPGHDPEFILDRLDPLLDLPANLVQSGNPDGENPGGLCSAEKLFRLSHRKGREEERVHRHHLG